MIKNDDTYHATHYVIAMLKLYGIKNIVASPGTQNAFFNYLVQDDPDFNCISVIDERSAAYVATGIARESGEPVVITCTGATASRNYMSALTEAYYSELPIIALTFFDEKTNQFAISPQYIDRKISQNDVKTVSVELPQTRNWIEKRRCVLFLNAALATAMYRSEPVHINCPGTLEYLETDNKLPKDIWRTEYITDNFRDLAGCFSKKRTALFLGSHKRFTKNTEEMISKFCQKYNIPVICDHTSNYHGENKILSAQITDMQTLDQKPELLIDFGGICGEYAACSLYPKTEVWRIAPKGKFASRLGLPVTKIFACDEKYFFEEFCNAKASGSLDFYNYVKRRATNLVIPDLPLCNSLICQHLAKNLPGKSTLHLSILNALRCMNFFDLDESIDVNCNVGGFGIDGAVSTIVGQSLANKNKNFFALIGDLAFFYDMNAIGNRDISKNLHIIVNNNNRGMEFRLNPALENPLADKNDPLIAAAGHNGSGVKGWAEACGFHYMRAENKDEFLRQISAFCKDDFGKPVIFEVFTETADEQAGLKLMQQNNRSAAIVAKDQTNNFIGKIRSLIKG